MLSKIALRYQITAIAEDAPVGNGLSKIALRYQITADGEDIMRVS